MLAFASFLQLLFVFGAAISPEQIHLSLVSASNMNIMWSTSVPVPSFVKYGFASGKYIDEAVGAACRSYSAAGYTSGCIHNVTLSKLKNNAIYFYIVGDGNHWSEEFSFTTPPIEGSSQPFIVAIVGDVGTTENSKVTYASLLEGETADDLRTDFVYHVGDLSYANADEPLWDNWGHLVEPVAATRPYMTLPGNHEAYNNFAGYNHRFTMPGSQDGGNNFFAFNYGMAHFISLTSEHDYGTNSPQYKWLINHLPTIDRTKFPWLIVGFHRPFYNSNTAHQGEATEFGQIYEDLFYKFKVDFVFCGHVHAYERFFPVYKNQVTADAPVYFTVGDGGTDEGLANGWLVQPPYSAFRKAMFGYSQIQFLNATHAHYSWLVNVQPQFQQVSKAIRLLQRRKASSAESHMVGDDVIYSRPFPRL